MMERKEKLILILGVALVLIVGGVFSYIYYSYYEVREVPVFIEVKERALGFNTNTDLLNFGKVMPGGSGKRFMEISSDRRALLVMEGKGETGKWLVIEPNNIILEAGEVKRISFLVKVPEEVEEKKYEGSVKFYFKRP